MQGGSKLNIEVVAQRETTGIPAGYAAEYVMGGWRTWRSGGAMLQERDNTPVEKQRCTPQTLHQLHQLHPIPIQINFYCFSHRTTIFTTALGKWLFVRYYCNAIVHAA
jgi:hypothetical protein